jgi:hypothetical protein
MLVDRGKNSAKEVPSEIKMTSQVDPRVEPEMWKM